jgi:hypothetical protein
VYLAGARLGCSVSPLITSWTQALPTAPTSDPTPCRCRSGEHVPGAGAETRAPCRVARSCPTPADRHCCTRAGRAGPFHLTVGERTFAYPASPWLPKKGSDLSVHSGEELQRVQDRLNHRPRKTLDQQTQRKFSMRIRSGRAGRPGGGWRRATMSMVEVARPGGVRCLAGVLFGWSGFDWFDSPGASR